MPAYWGQPSVKGTSQPERIWRRSSCDPRWTRPYIELVWIKKTSDRVIDRTSAEEKPTESPVTEGKIVPTLKEKDTRSAEPAGRPQQATSPGTSRQSPLFNLADHQKLIRKIPHTEPLNSPSTSKPQPDQSYHLLPLQLLNNSIGILVTKTQKTILLPPHPKKSDSTTQKCLMEIETFSTNSSKHAMPTSISTLRSSAQTRRRFSSYSPIWPSNSSRRS